MFTADASGLKGVLRSAVVLKPSRAPRIWRASQSLALALVHLARLRLKPQRSDDSVEIPSNFAIKTFELAVLAGDEVPL